MKTRVSRQGLRTLVIAAVLLLAAVMPLSATGTPVMTEAAKPTVRFLMGDPGMGTFDKDNYVVKEFAKQMGDVNLEMVLIPRSDMSAKFSTIIASGDLPDIMMIESIGREMTLQYGPKGLFYAIDRKFGQMPNLAKIRTEVIPYFDKSMKAADGHIYGIPKILEFHKNVFYQGYKSSRIC